MSSHAKGLKHPEVPGVGHIAGCQSQLVTMGLPWQPGKKLKKLRLLDTEF
jgi:hypothetical protein